MAKPLPISIDQSDMNAARAAGLGVPPSPGTWVPIAGRKYRNEQTGEETTRRRVENARRHINFDRRVKEREKLEIPKGPGRGRKGQKVGMRGEYTKAPKHYTEQYVYKITVTTKTGETKMITLLEDSPLTKKEAFKKAREIYKAGYQEGRYPGKRIASLEVSYMHFEPNPTPAE